MGVEHGIIFNSDTMIRALASGTKTQMRFIVKQEITAGAMSRGAVQVVGAGEENILISGCPYGQPGDVFWVKEDFRARSWSADGGWGEIEYMAGGFRSVQLINNAPWSFFDAYPDKHQIDRWRPAANMPRWATRISRKITSVKVVRLQAMTEDDARAEGVDILSWGGAGDIWLGQHGDKESPDTRDPLKVFAHIWDTLNGKRSNWSSNPWVWVLTFEKA